MTPHPLFYIIGLSAIVTNQDPSSITALWNEFHHSNTSVLVSEKKSDDIYCVYHDYEGDASKPYRMTIGYKVDANAAIPENLIKIDIPAQDYAVFEAVGEQPATLINQWQSIWQSDLKRAFSADFDVYDANDPSRVTVHVGIKD